MLSQATGHRVEIPAEPGSSTYTHVFVITEIEQYSDEKLASTDFGFDIIGKIAGVLSWEVLPKEQLTAQYHLKELSKAELGFLLLLENLPLPISIIQRTDGTFVWKWLNAHGQAETYMDAIRDALSYVMKAYQFIRSELIG
jgi:hypothetical protein